MPADDKTLLALGLSPLKVTAAAPQVIFYALGLDMSDKRFAAVAALTGVIVTASASVIGLLVNRGSASRLETRLRLEAAMKAGELFNEAGDSPPDPAAMASGLLALTDLDRADLAVALLVERWDTRGDGQPTTPLGRPCVTNETAILVLDAALRSTNRTAQLVAAELLCRNASRLDITQSLHWPSSIDGKWNPRYGVKTKVLIVDALVQMALDSKRSLNSLQSLAVRLYGISKGDPDKHVKGCVGMLLTAIVPALDDLKVRSLMEGPSEIKLEHIKDAARWKAENPDRVFAKIVLSRSESLAEWATKCSEIDFDPGALAATA